MEALKAYSPAKLFSECNEFLKTPGSGAYIRQELLMGIILACAQMPLTMSYSFLAGLEPYVGLRGAWIVNFIASVFGGRPGMMYGICGGIGLIIAGFQREVDGRKVQVYEHLYVVIIISGFFLCLVYKFKLYRFFTLMPTTVVVGFKNGLGLVIATSQQKNFKDPHTHHFIEDKATLAWCIFITLITMIIMEFLPKIKHKLARTIPSSLLAVVAAIFIEFAIVRPAGYHTFTVGDVATLDLDTAIPMPFFVNPLYDTNKKGVYDFGRIIQDSIMLTLVTIIEALMVQEVVDGFLGNEGDRGKTVLALGFGNIISGFFGGTMAGGMLGLSVVNVINGGRGRLSTVFCSFLVMLCSIVLYPVLNFIPTTALAGIMFIVAIKTFYWGSLKLMVAAVLPLKLRKKIGLHVKVNRLDVAVIVTVMFITLFANLVYAVLIGVCATAIYFSYAISHRIQVVRNVDESGEVVYMVEGPIFFASKMMFEKKFQYRDDPEIVEVNLENATIFDYSGLEAINTVANKYKKVNKKLKLRALNATSRNLYLKARNLNTNIDYEGKIWDGEDMESSSASLLDSQESSPHHS